MPIYEYFCKNCGKFEELERHSDPPLKSCPHCKNKVDRVLSVTGSPQFKGTGFYETDYKKAKT